MSRERERWGKTALTFCRAVCIRGAVARCVAGKACDAVADQAEGVPGVVARGGVRVRQPVEGEEYNPPHLHTARKRCVD